MIPAVLGLLAGRARPVLHDPGGDEVVEPFGEDVGRHPETLLKLREARDAGEHGIAQDQRAPALADQFEGTRRRAVLIFVKTSKHGLNISH
jgi:hypothetical protein